MDEAQNRYNSYIAALQSSYDIVSSNRDELSGVIVRDEEPAQEEAQETAE